MLLSVIFKLYNKNNLIVLIFTQIKLSSFEMYVVCRHVRFVLD